MSFVIKLSFSKPSADWLMDGIPGVLKQLAHFKFSPLMYSCSNFSINYGCSSLNLSLTKFHILVNCFLLLHTLMLRIGCFIAFNLIFFCSRVSSVVRYGKYSWSLSIPLKYVLKLCLHSMFVCSLKHFFIVFLWVSDPSDITWVGLNVIPSISRVCLTASIMNMYAFLA